MKKCMEKLESLLELGGTKKDIALLVISGIALLCSLFDVPLPFSPAWIAIILCGVPIVLEAVIGLVTRFDIKADVLVSIALISSVCLHENFAAGEVAFIMQLGALLEDLTLAKARAGIEKLVHLTPQTARRIQNGGEEIIPAEEVQTGDILRVLPGETIPVDGVILSGETAVNQAVMTGKSLPVDKKPGDDVASGTVNQFGAFDMKATKVGADSSIQRMIRLVQSADAGKAKIVGLADRWATWIVVTALTASILIGFITKDLIRAVTILVVFCPCALVLATPTAIMAAIGNATKHGFLVREGNALERLAKVNTIAFDKTGTLTTGCFDVTDMQAHRISESELLTLLLSVEQKSTHPIAQAIVRYAKKQNISAASVSEMHELAGHGVEAVIGGQEVLVGNIRLMKERGISIPEELSDQVATVVICAIDKKYAGHLLLSDTLKDDAVEAIAKLRKLGVTDIRLLSGDKKEIVASFARRLGIDRAYGNLLPEDKAAHIREMVEEPGKTVAFVGDGMNDAPVLALSHVGIAMGGLGSDAAIESADVVIQNDQPSKVATAITIGRKTRTIVHQNIIGALVVKGIVLSAGALGYATLWGAVFADVGVALLAVLNSVRILNRKVW